MSLICGVPVAVDIDVETRAVGEPDHLRASARAIVLSRRIVFTEARADHRAINLELWRFVGRDPSIFIEIDPLEIETTMKVIHPFDIRAELSDAGGVFDRLDRELIGRSPGSHFTSPQKL